MAKSTEQANMLTKLDNRLRSIGITSPTHESTLQQVTFFKDKIIKAFELPQQKRIFDVLGLMMEIHKDQEPRSDGSPYVDHPLDVATSVYDYIVLAESAFEHMSQKDADIVIAALLHDSVEDQASKLAKKGKGLRRTNERQKALSVIDHKYGSRVTQIVCALSNPNFDEILEKDGITPDSSNYTIRKNELYKNHVEEAIKDPDVLLIKYFDFISNAFRLDGLPEGPVKIKLLCKYTPVVRVFIERLALDAGTLNVDPTYRQQLIDDLYDHEEKMLSQLEDYR